MKRTNEQTSIPALVERMRAAGAAFRQIGGGLWFVENLASLPDALRDQFYQADEKTLSAYLHKDYLTRQSLDPVNSRARLRDADGPDF